MWPEVREAQRVTTETTQNTAMAVTVDIGDATDIHPKQKKPIGERLALAARALAYGEAIEYSGPTYDSMSVSGNRVTLKFKHLGGGLVAKDGACEVSPSPEPMASSSTLRPRSKETPSSSPANRWPVPSPFAMAGPKSRMSISGKGRFAGFSFSDRRRVYAGARL